MAELHVTMAGRRIGVLDGRDRRNLRFTYDESWTADPAATPLSVSMPLTAGTHSGRVVEPYLWGLLPDNDRVLARWAAVLKPAIAGLDGHDLNEHLCLAAAGRLGLRVAHTEVRRFDGERALVVRRYDRVPVPGGGIARVHQEDMCQALSVHPATKYQAEGGPGVEQMAAALRAATAGDATADVDALCRGVAYNWLVLGTDAHAKNYSLLLSGRQVRLAPLYDIASAAAYGDHPRSLRMAQKIGGEYRPTIIAARHWARLARAVGIDPDGVHDDIVAMIERLPDALVDTIAATDLDARETHLAGALIDVVTRWTSTCQTALRRTDGDRG